MLGLQKLYDRLMLLAKYLGSGAETLQFNALKLI